MPPKPSGRKSWLAKALGGHATGALTNRNLGRSALRKRIDRENGQPVFRRRVSVVEQESFHFGSVVPSFLIVTTMTIRKI